MAFRAIGAIERDGSRSLIAIAADRRRTAGARTDRVIAALPAGSRPGASQPCPSSLAAESPTGRAELMILLMPEPHTCPSDLALSHLARMTCRETY